MKIFHRDQVKEDPNHLTHIRDTLTCLAEHAGKAVEVRIDFKAPPKESLGVDYEALEEFTGLTLYGRLMMKVIDLPDGTKMPSFGVMPFSGPEWVEEFRRQLNDGERQLSETEEFGMMSHCAFALEQVAGIEVLSDYKKASTVDEAIDRFDQAANRGDREDGCLPQLKIMLAPEIHNEYQENWFRVPTLGRLLDGMVGGGKL